MKQLSLLAIGCALLIFTGCTFGTKNKIEKKQDSVNVDTKAKSKIELAFEDAGVKFEDLAQVGSWTFNIPADPKNPASEPIKYIAYLYKDMKSDRYYLLEHDLLEECNVVRNVFVIKKGDMYHIVIKDNPSLKYRFDSKGYCWEHEDGLKDSQGIGNVNLDLL